MKKYKILKTFMVDERHFYEGTEFTAKQMSQQDIAEALRQGWAKVVRKKVTANDTADG